MSLNEIEGNGWIIRRMREAARSQNVSHAYILEGDISVDKVKVAREFVKAVLCTDRAADGSGCDRCLSCQKIDHGNHEDVMLVTTEKSSIKDEDVEAMQRHLSTRPGSGNRNVVIVDKADTMTVWAQNRLLKTLEEPAPGTMILLLSENCENLAQTIRSRCILYRLHGRGRELSVEACETAAAVGEQWLNREPFYRLTASVGPALSDRATAAEFLDALELWLRDCMISPYDKREELTGESRWPQTASQLLTIARRCGKERIYLAIASVEETRQDLRRNINVGYAVKGMLLK